jgi:hypothetical protein
MEALEQFDGHALMAEASRRTGGRTDFGDARLLEALPPLLKSFDDEARLSATGRHLLRGRILELLANRLRMEEHFRRHPAILEERVDQPVVIVGLPRTGTTLLQRVLACDPRFYAMQWWESRHPVPPADAAPGGPDPRITLAKAEVRAMIEAMPQLLSIHPLDAEQADEEVMLMEHSFHSSFDAFCNVPGYMAWQSTRDHVPAYADLRKQLQFLQWQKRQRGLSAQRRVLKTPNHLVTMAALFEVFPDATVIQCHRDPLQTIPSLCSFIQTLWRIYSDHADSRVVGAHWSAKMARALAGAMTVRDALPPGRFHDVWFGDTVSRPMAVVEALYAAIGMPLEQDVAQRMQQWLALNQRDKRAAHDYDAAQFGLGTEQLEHDFAAYRQRYILPRASARAAA